MGVDFKETMHNHFMTEENVLEQERLSVRHKIQNFGRPFLACQFYKFNLSDLAQQ